jgi:trk system potassium uptake protein TrkA
MRAIIIGAGAAGQQLARILTQKKNDVVVIDTDEAPLARLRDNLDVMALAGNGATVRTLLEAGIEKTDILLAVGGNSEANLLACSLAGAFDVKTKIARVQSRSYFNAGKGVTPESLSVDQVVNAEYVCAMHIMECLQRSPLKESVHFSDAQMVNFQVNTGSPMIGHRLSELTASALSHVRICGVLRHGHLIIPRGDTVLAARDEIYAAGDAVYVDELIQWAIPDAGIISRVIISGATRLGRMLAGMLAIAGMDVCVIESDQAEAEAAADQLGDEVLIIHGDATENDILLEAGIDHCDAFIGARVENERNIVSCMLAKRHGARKVVAVTDNMDYLQIISRIEVIDCAFSPLVSAVNEVLGHIDTDYRKTVAMLKRAPAEIIEIPVTEKSGLIGKHVQQVDCPPEAALALIHHGSHISPIDGAGPLEEGDRIVLLVETDAIQKVERQYSSARKR